jgi:hypothetical protein
MVIAVLNNARAVPEISIETFTKNWRSFDGLAQIFSRITTCLWHGWQLVAVVVPPRPLLQL